MDPKTGSLITQKIEGARRPPLVHFLESKMVCVRLQFLSTFSPKDDTNSLLKLVISHPFDFSNHKLRNTLDEILRYKLQSRKHTSFSYLSNIHVSRC